LFSFSKNEIFFNLLIRIDQLNEEKKQYLPILDIVRQAIPLFPRGSLQGGADGVIGLVSRYETLVQTKNDFEQRDYSKEVCFFEFEWIQLYFILFYLFRN
jgi:hypothetical protein